MLYSDEVFHSLSGLCQNLCHFSRKNARKVPTTFNEMLLFNASVMGYGASTWMSIVLVQFDVMVTGLLQVSSTMRGVEHVLFVRISSSQPKKTLRRFTISHHVSMKRVPPRQSWNLRDGGGKITFNNLSMTSFLYSLLFLLINIHWHKKQKSVLKYVIVKSHNWLPKVTVFLLFQWNFIPVNSCRFWWRNNLLGDSHFARTKGTGGHLLEDFPYHPWDELNIYLDELHGIDLW